MLQSPIEFKAGDFTLSVIYLYHHEPEIICKAIKKKISQFPLFFENIPVVLNIAGLNNKVNWKNMQEAILSTGIYIVGVIGCKDIVLRDIILNLGIPILTERKKNENKCIKSISDYPVAYNKMLCNKTTVINTPVRSGQQIYSRNSDLIVIANVNTGAELISDGNIHIYGVMRGRAIAGASGDHSCYIFCSYLVAELVSIAGKYWVMDQIPQKFFYKSTSLYLKQDILTMQELN
ncbi:MAG: septum site-determining protein MinC [Pantoea sp. Brub]|nr:septum site-determining protein MinC [Pantoea sp. Brub]